MKQIYPQGVKALFAALFTSIIFLSGNVFAIDNIDNSLFYSGSSAASFSRSVGERKILDLVNEEREKRRMPILKWDSRLANLARSYSSKMARENFFGHKDSNGSTLIQRAKEFNITDWSGIGENLYYCKGFDDPTEPAFAGWMKSAGHRSNMLNNSWKTTGIGIARSSDGKIYVTQVFMK